jgi:hypothetical protein
VFGFAAAFAAAFAIAVRSLKRIRIRANHTRLLKKQRLVREIDREFSVALEIGLRLHRQRLWRAVVRFAGAAKVLTSSAFATGNPCGKCKKTPKNALFLHSGHACPLT